MFAESAVLRNKLRTRSVSRRWQAPRGVRQLVGNALNGSLRPCRQIFENLSDAQ